MFFSINSGSWGVQGLARQLINQDGGWHNCLMSLVSTIYFRSIAVCQLGTIDGLITSILHPVVLGNCTNLGIQLAANLAG